MFPFTQWWAPSLGQDARLKQVYMRGWMCVCMCLFMCMCVCKFLCVLVNLVIKSVFVLMCVLVCMSVFVFFFVCVWVCFLCIYSHGQDAHVEQNPILCVFLLMHVSRYEFALVCFVCVRVCFGLCVFFCLPSWSRWSFRARGTHVLLVPRGQMGQI